MEVTKVDRLIRNLNLDTYNRAQAEAKIRGYKSFGPWANEAFALKLKQDKAKK